MRFCTGLAPHLRRRRGPLVRRQGPPHRPEPLPDHGVPAPLGHARAPRGPGHPRGSDPDAVLHAERDPVRPLKRGRIAREERPGASSPLSAPNLCRILFPKRPCHENPKKFLSRILFFFSFLPERVISKSKMCLVCLSVCSSVIHPLLRPLRPPILYPEGSLWVPSGDVRLLPRKTWSKLS
jgi:hypothetical protein